ncbi:AMP-binding protein [Micromonospora sp. NPDC050495]|uniref:AMP-binding protein n=1 Tax=Micromonospora sp. NPDC050495 TaxID=3154936 RepID=UPI0033ECEC39
MRYSIDRGTSEPAMFAFSELTPTSFLARSARVHADRPAIIDGEHRFSYRQFADRSLRLAGALAALDIQPGDRVAVLASNSHVMLECHHGIPTAGAVLVPLNIRLSAHELAWIIQHCAAKALICTGDLVELAERVVATTGINLIDESAYESALSTAEPLRRPCADERGLLAINYTSGTTGDPKGAMYHHLGAYLQALSMVVHTELNARSRYLSTLPMFHCDGWCFPWAVTAAGATHVCLRKFSAAAAWRALREESVTHFSAAPTILTMIADASEVDGSPLPHRVSVQTGGAPPGSALLARLDRLGFDVTHLYGLTETSGPVAVNDWHPEWDEFDQATRARLSARQGVGNVTADQVRVVDDDGADVPADATTIGEIALRGNTLMLGYYRDPERTRAASIQRSDETFFRTGDLAVRHPDGYIEIRDRRKDVIISGGENISSVEVERVLDHHPSILESAVVACPDEQWGEVPVAFVTLRDDAESFDEGSVVAFLRTRLAGFKVPKRFVIGPLPKTSTGKIQKNILREQL